MAITGELPSDAKRKDVAEMMLSDERKQALAADAKSLFYTGFYAAVAQFHVDTEMHLFALSEQAINNEEQQCFFNAARMYKAAFTELDYQLSVTLEQETKLDQSQDTGFGLIENQTIERELAIKRGIAAVKSRSPELMNAIKVRLGPIWGGEDAIDDCPIGIRRIVQVYSHCLGELGLEHKAELAVMRYFGQQMSKPLIECYGQVNSFLLEQGIYEVLPHERKQQEDQQEKPNSGSVSDEAVAKANQQLVTAIQSLMTRLDNQVSMIPQPMAFQPGQVPELTDVVAVPSGIAAGVDLTNKVLAVTAPQPMDAAQINPELLQRIEKAPQDYAQTVQLVGLIFQYMLDEPALPAPVKALLSYLHTPYLQLALEAPDMLQNPKHSARRLIDEMVEAGTRWVSETGESQYGVLELIHKTVTVISEVSPCTEDHIEQQCQGFIQFHQLVCKRVAIAERRTAERARVENERRQAEMEVLKEYEAIAIKRAPGVIVKLLQGPWKQYAVQLLQKGDTRQFKQAVKFAGVMVASQSSKNFASQPDYERACSVVYRGIDKGLEAIGRPREERTGLIKALRALHANQSSNLVKVEPVVKVEEDNQHPRRDEFMQHLRLMEVGSWIEREDGETRNRYKVGSSDNESFLLIDQSGRRGELVPIEQLAQQFAEGRCRVLSGSTKPFFERALKSIYSSLQSSEERS